MPLYGVCKVSGLSDEMLYRATMLSYLVCTYIKEYSGRLSAFCGCAIAAGTGMACGLVYLKGGTVEQMEYTINNMASSITGMICDGGNQGCTMKGIAWGDQPGFTKSLQASFRPLIVSAVKTNLPAVIKNEGIDLLEIDEKLDLISASLREKIKAGFEEYGLTIPQFYVTTIVLPEDDPNFKRIRDLHTIVLQTRVIQAEATVKTVEAQAQAQYRTAQEQSAAAIMFMVMLRTE